MEWRVAMIEVAGRLDRRRPAHEGGAGYDAFSWASIMPRVTPVIYQLPEVVGVDD